MADFYSSIASDNFRLAKSKLITAQADGVLNLIRIPKAGFVRNVWLWVKTPYTGGTPSLTVGWIGNAQTSAPAGFMSNTIAEPKVAGLKSAWRDNVSAFQGKYFDAASGAVTITIAKGGATVEAVFAVFVDYTVIY